MKTRIVIVLAVVVLTVTGALGQSPCKDTDYDCKIAALRTRIAAEPKNAELRYNLAAALQGKGLYQDSIRELTTYLSSGVTNAEYLADGYEARAKAYKNVGKYELAVADYSELIRRRSGNAAAYFSRGYCYMELKDYPKSTADFTKVIALQPTNSEAFYNRGTIHYRLKEYTAAIADLTKYIDLNQAEPAYLADGYANRGLAYFFSGNAVKAADDETKAIGLNPNDKAFYRYRAQAYRKLGKIALADADEKKEASMP